MVGKQKKRLSNIFLAPQKIVLILLSIGVFGFTAVSFNSTEVAAIGNCPGTEIQGNGQTNSPDTNKCYSVTPTGGTATNNTPTGVTTPNTDTTASGDTKTDDKTDDKGATCAIEKIGWILCPIIQQAGKISDKAFDILANNFLRTDPQLVGDKSGTKTAWEIARNLANIMFIIAFVIIILSQVTGQGINNYGIKRMLPRLIIAAIAVNISYYICQLAVDLTNILGYEIQNTLADISDSLGPSVFGSVTPYAGSETQTTGGDTLLTVIAVASTAVAGAIWLTLPMLVSVIMFVFITVVTIIIILLLRKAIIVLLVVISPIAFVMYLLPNTEKLFSKWLHMFWQLLLVFPIVALLFGGGQLASTIVLVSGAQTDDQASAASKCDSENREDVQKFNSGSNGTKTQPNNYDSCGSGSVVITGNKDGAGNATPRTASWTLGLVAMGIAVAPLMAVWAVLKGALSAAGAIGGKIAANVSKGVDKGARGGAKAVGDKYKESTLGQAMARNKKIREGNVRAGSGEGISAWRVKDRARARLNRGLNNMGRNSEGILGDYHGQRGRMANKALAEQSRDWADEFTSLGTYAEEFQNGQREYQNGHANGNQSQIEQGWARMNAARAAATRLHDDRAAQAMAPQIAEAQQSIRFGRASDERRGAMRMDAAHTEANGMNAEYDRRAAETTHNNAMSTYNAQLQQHQSEVNAVTEHRRQVQAHNDEIQRRANMQLLGTPDNSPMPAHPGPEPTVTTPHPGPPPTPPTP